MTVFEDLFLDSLGKPVMYQGTLIHLIDILPVAADQRVRVVFESENSNWRQGILLSTDGTFEVNGQKIKKKTVLWKDTAPQTVDISIKSKNGECIVKNVWDTGNGGMDSGHNGAAMIVEKIENGRRYRCNDGLADDDFDDLVFRIELQ